MITQICTILHIFLILISAFAIIVLPPKYFTKWINKNKYWNKRHNETRNFAIWCIFLLIIDIIISLNYDLW